MWGSHPRYNSPPQLKRPSAQRDDADDDDTTATADTDAIAGASGASAAATSSSSSSVSDLIAGAAPAAALARHRADTTKWVWVGDASSDHHQTPDDKQMYAYYERVRSVTGEFELALGDGVHLKSADAPGALPYVARVRGLCEER